MTCFAAISGPSPAPAPAPADAVSGPALAGMRRSRSEPLLRCSLAVPRPAAAPPTMKSSRSASVLPLVGSVFTNSMRSLLFDDNKAGAPIRGASIVERDEEEEVTEMGDEKRSNWVSKILELRHRWRDRRRRENENDDEGDYVCEVNYEEDGEETDERVWDRESFRRLLGRARWSEAKVFAQLAFLCNMAYVIPEMKEADLISHYGLRFVTSSLEKKLEAATKAKLEADSTRPPRGTSSSLLVSRLQAQQCPPSVAYGIAASAASYVHSCTNDALSLGALQFPELDGTITASPSSECKPETAAAMATSTITTVVAAEADARQQAAKDLRSLHSSPCEWFICDDPGTCTRCFVIQGSDSLASWQANLFFEPTKFEDKQVWVHRGIYEAAKGIYEQFMPEILAHLKRYGERARFRFTGHSLGGSLSLLVSLMIMARGVVKQAVVLPVVTFGSPSIFCGGQRVLEELGLDEEFLCSVMMHRDIVPRAFSCNYPHHVAQVLKRINGAFWSHPCLNNEKLLYSPLGKTYILQPDENSSPFHPLLPPEAALYVLEGKNSWDNPSKAVVTDALRTFLNSPHPLETLSHPSAYGSEGTILRDHDSSNYVKAINGLLRQHTKYAVRRSKKQRLQQWWPLLTTQTDGMNSNSWRRYHIPALEKSASVSNEAITGA